MCSFCAVAAAAAAVRQSHWRTSATQKCRCRILAENREHVWQVWHAAILIHDQMKLEHDFNCIYELNIGTPHTLQLLFESFIHFLWHTKMTLHVRWNSFSGYEYLCNIYAGGAEFSLLLLFMTLFWPQHNIDRTGGGGETIPSDLFLSL